MVRGGVRENPSAQRPPAQQQATESKGAKEYRAFASEILASSYNDLGVIRAKASNFAEAAELFKQAGAWNPHLAGLDRNWGLAAYRAELYSHAIPPPGRPVVGPSREYLVPQLLRISYFLAENFFQ